MLSLKAMKLYTCRQRSIGVQWLLLIQRVRSNSSLTKGSGISLTTRLTAWQLELAKILQYTQEELTALQLSLSKTIYSTFKLPQKF